MRLSGEKMEAESTAIVQVRALRYLEGKCWEAKGVADGVVGRVGEMGDGTLYADYEVLLSGDCEDGLGERSDSGGSGEGEVCGWMIKGVEMVSFDQGMDILLQNLRSHKSISRNRRSRNAPHK